MATLSEVNMKQAASQTEHRTGSTLKVICITVAVTLLVTGATLYYFDLLTLDIQPQVAASAPSGQDEPAGDTMYISPMHPWIVSDEPGQCPICGMDLVPVRDGQLPGTASASAERQVAYWRAPMNPQEIYASPGKSAMGMELIPVYEDELVGGVDIVIDPVTQQNMAIRTARVERQPLVHTVRTYGHVTYDETRTAQMSPKISGWLEKLHVDFAGQHVGKGEPLFEIYAPELVAAQEEYLAAFRSTRRLPGAGQANLLESARRRLQYYDIADREIQALENTGKVQKTVLIRSPFRGTVIRKMAEEGSYVKSGATVYRIADLSRVWVEAHIFEYELPWIRAGQEATMTLPYWPGQVWTGKVAYVYPYLQPKTRDVIVRLEFDNANLQLKPDMYADIRITTHSDQDGLVIPTEAVIRSGARNVVFVAKGEGKFSPREVALGLSIDGGKVQLLTGLAPGDVVVTSGQFLLDSESKLQEAVQKMMQVKMASTKPAKAARDDFFSDVEKAEKDDGFFKDMESEKTQDFFKDMELNTKDAK
jgi:Cu(I)/Ag(I) efflux system membrane fusion protein/cobalt-zinc-cadmium efflux system membrane fusion protein